MDMFQRMYPHLITYGQVVVIAVLVFIAILLLAKYGAYFTRIAQGTTIFISAGDSLRAILPNVGGFKMSDSEDLEGRHWLVPEKNDLIRMKAFFHKSLPGTVWFQSWLWQRFGVRFISLVWPHVHIHRFDIRKGGRRRIEARAEKGADAPLQSRVVDSDKDTEVDHLLFMVPRPVHVRGVEFGGDNSRINLLLLPVFRQVIPALPAYYLKGDFFTLLDAVIEAAMVNFFASHRVAVYKEDCSEGKEGEFAKDFFEEKEDGEEFDGEHLTYAHWVKLTKAGEKSPMERQLLSLNVNQDYRNLLANLKSSPDLVKYIDELTHGKPAEIFEENLRKKIPGGLIPRFGFALVSFRIVEWEAHSSTIDLAAALLEKETHFHKAQGVREIAYGVRDSILAKAEAESSRYKRLIDALIGKGVNADVAAQVVRTQIRTENVRDSKLTTYVEGGGTSTSILVPASSSNS